MPPTVTVTGPVVTPFGTLTVSLVKLAVVTVASTPLNETMFCAGIKPKP